MKYNHFQYLDFFRGIAAILVLLGHARAFIFIPYGNYNDTGLLIRFFYFVTGFGHQSVVVFFVLSGFLITFSTFRDKSIPYLRFMALRLARLWIVLVPALCLTFLFDSAGRMHDINDFYSGALNDKYAFNVSNEFSYFSFLSNLFYLQGLASDVFGTNSPLWSLSYEFWYYFLFPFICYFFISLKGGYYKKSASFFLLIMFFVVVLYIFNQKMIYMYFIWLLGSLVCYIYSYKKLIYNRLISYPIIILLFFLIVTGYSRLSHASELVIDYVFSISFSLLLLCAIGRNINNKHLSWFSKRSSQISYALYLTHFPLLSLLSTFLLQNQRFDFCTEGVFYYILFVSLSFIVAFLFYFMFESHYIKIKIWIYNKLD